MAAPNMQDAGFAGPTLGMECAGIGESVGPGVALRKCARVFGVAPAVPVRTAAIAACNVYWPNLR